MTKHPSRRKILIFLVQVRVVLSKADKRWSAKKVFGSTSYSKDAISVHTAAYLSCPVLMGLKADAAPVVSKPLVSTHCPPSRSRLHRSRCPPLSLQKESGQLCVFTGVLCFSEAQCESTVRSPTHSWATSRPAGHDGKEVHLLGVSADPLSFWRT